MDTDYNLQQSKHHDHHHHHHHSSSNSETLAGEVKKYVQYSKKEKKCPDSTSKFRIYMGQRHLRKRIFERLLLVFAILLTCMVGMGVIFAYYIDT